MKYEVVNIVQQYKEGNINATEAMNTIVTYIFPEIVKDDVYIKRLIAFMWNIETSDLIGTGTSKQPESMARTMYTKILYDKYNVTAVRIGEMLNTRALNVSTRLRAHEGLILSHAQYKKIYNIITKVL